jgi:hypothetical protein
VCVNSAFQQRRSWRDKLFGRAVPVDLAKITDQDKIGLVCSVCHGIGTDEPKTLRFHNWFLPCFAAGFVFLLLLLLAFSALVDKVHFQAVLTFAATAVGGVTGYYFGGAKQQISSVAQRSVVDAKKPG